MIRLSLVLCALIVALVLWLVIDVRSAGSDGTPSVDLPPFRESLILRRLEQASQREQQLVELRQRLRLEHRRLLAARHRVRTLRRTLMSSSSVSEAIDLASATYGYGSTLWRKARCETGGTFSSRAYNPSGASGLFQFLPSTWRSTPYGGFSIWSPYANALAAGWMHAHGRGGEWVCR